MGNKRFGSANSGLNPIDSAVKRYKSARWLAFLLGALSIVNIFMLTSQSMYYFLFSSYIAFYFVDLGMAVCGKYPEEMYEGGYGEYEFLDESFLYAMIAVALIVSLVYFLFFFFSNKGRSGWLIAAIVYYAIDTAFMLYMCGIVNILSDIVAHALILVMLVWGVRACGKLKEASAAEFSPKEDAPATEEGEDAPVDTVVIRSADPNVKSRTLVSADNGRHNIVYRRVKNVNELLIDNAVYAECVVSSDTAHKLEVIKEGHRITASTDYIGKMMITVDGQEVAAKYKLF